MKIEEILAEQSIESRISALKKGRKTSSPDLAAVIKGWNPNDHEIFNLATRPDKTVVYDIPDENDPEKVRTGTRIEKVARIAISLQRLIVKRAVSFLFGNPVKVISSVPDSKIAEAIARVLKDNKERSLNRKVAKELFSATEVAEYWYGVGAEDFNSYGFKTDVKIRSAIFSPLKGDELYPYFDQTGDMVAFSRGYKAMVSGKDVNFFETWTKDKYFRYKQEDGTWREDLPEGVKEMQLGKIPIVYAYQEGTEWSDVQVLIDRIEKLLSNFADTNDYHGSPLTVVRGEVKGYAKKGETGGIIEVEGDGEVKKISWDQAPESIKLEIDTLLRMIYSISQTPDISFDAVKGLGSAASGQSLKMLFLDAHLKVMEKMETFDDYLQRRLNLLKEFVVKLNSSAFAREAQTLDLTPEVTPYMIDDEANTIDNLATARSVGIISKQTAISMNPYVADSAKEYELIEAEAAQIDNSPTELDNLQNQTE